jgi:hypothetical protein
LDILKPYIGVKAYKSERALVIKYESMIQALKEKRDKEVLSLNLDLFKNFKSRKKIIDRYKEDIGELCCDIIMINNIKQCYENDKNLSIIEVGYESESTAMNVESYAIGYTTKFDDVQTEINEIADEVYMNNCYSDVCTLGYFTPDGSYKNLINCVFEHAQDYYGQYTYFMDTMMYPIVLELEKLINSKDNEFKTLILDYYNNNF